MKYMLLVVILLINIFSIRSHEKSVESAYTFANNEVTLIPSWIKLREDLNREYLYQLDPDRLLYNFRVNAGIKTNAQPLEGWESPDCGLRGHFVGHYLSACSSMVQKDGDTLLNQRIEYIVDALAECQQKLGGKYLSAFPDSDFAELETGFGKVWAPYYTFQKIMQGLLDVYTCTGNKKAFLIVLSMANYVQSRMDKLSKAQIEKLLYTADANPPNEAGGMNEVLQNLYAITKNPEHLKLAEIFDRKWFSQPLSEGVDILSGLHSNTHIALVNGFAKRYENTHVTYYRNAVVNFWEMIVYHHAYVNGSNSGPRPIATTPTSKTAEHWGVADHLSATLSGDIAESCVTHNTQKLTATLFSWTANPRYADAYMNTFYNSVMALQNDKTGASVYHLPLGSPRTKSFLKETDFRCCNGTSIEAFTKLNSSIYFHDDHRLWVNMFIPSTLNWKEKSVIIDQDCNFPEDSITQFRITTKSPIHFSLNLFIPSWANDHTKILLNGKPIKFIVKPFSFATIERIWDPGDQVSLIFNYDFYCKNMPDKEHVIALFYGPVLLAFKTDKELILKGNQEKILRSLNKNKDEFSFSLKNNGKEFKLIPFYKVKNESYGVYATKRNEY